MKWPKYLPILQLTCSIVILFASLQTLNFCLLTLSPFFAPMFWLWITTRKKNHSSDCNKVMICNFSHQPSKNTCSLSHALKQLLQFLDRFPPPSSPALLIPKCFQRTTQSSDSQRKQRPRDINSTGSSSHEWVQLHSVYNYDLCFSFSP